MRCKNSLLRLEKGNCLLFSIPDGDLTKLYQTPIVLTDSIKGGNEDINVAFRDFFLLLIFKKF